MKSMIIATLLSLFSSVGQAAVSSRILTTFWNQVSPEGKQIEIKNIDLVEHRYTYLSHAQSFYELYVYLWVKPDIGNQTKNLRVIDKNDPFHESYAYIPKVGIDRNGFYVYQVRMQVKDRFKMDLYAALRHDDRIYYSNEGHPNDFFHIEHGASRASDGARSIDRAGTPPVSGRTLPETPCSPSLVERE